MDEKKGDGKQNYKRLFKSRKDRIIDGVCGGFAEYLAVDVTLVRVVWAISIFVGGIGVIAYLLALFIIPINSEHINLKEPKKRKGNTNIVWGILLIVLGLILLSDWGGMPFHGKFPMVEFIFANVLAVTVNFIGVYIYCLYFK